ncbi:hypothetical protein PPERSA_12574 [Pseudocohnilembus persalinus]|uniref:Uncharacterized protein n=1 Tax=Pseudocohnilembus persalinus TaxID=266149 RepID=A0A0V0QCK6_PSEPJ|nr:hypothetical protein PPERSA_12574 [Pseudocohnilembus persalinus]|eukprot:KRW99898.1 hypothetical protein PPERSA_12574 [Pseudocohnilembus persalinus]
MNNYQDNLQKYKYKDTDIFNRNIDSTSKSQQLMSSEKKNNRYNQRTNNIFPSEQDQNNYQQQMQANRVVKPFVTQSQVFSTEPAEKQRDTIKRTKIQDSDIFNQSPNKQEVQIQNKGKKQSYKQQKESEETKDFPKIGKKIDFPNKLKENDIIFQKEDKNYQVTKNKNKDFSQLEAKQEQLMQQYKQKKEKYDYLRSHINGYDKDEYYDKYTTSKLQKLQKQEKIPFNVQFDNQERGEKTKVNEQAVFDRATYAHDKRNKDFQSQIFMNDQQIEEAAQKSKQNIAKNIEQLEMAKSQIVSEIEKRKQDRNYSEINGYSVQNQKQGTQDEAQKTENSGEQNYKNKQSSFLPSNVKFQMHDSTLYKNVGNNQNQDEQNDDNQIQKSHQFQKQQQQFEKFENFQVVEDTGLENQEQELDKSSQIQNQDEKNQPKTKQELKQQQIQEASDFNKSRIQKKQKQLTEDPQRIEQWEVDPYKDRVSLLQQRKQQEVPVKVIELDLKGITEKFDSTTFKKILQRKGYHMVDLDLKYNFNKPTGKGKLILRNNRKIAEGVESVKSHLKSLGVGVMKEAQVDATLNNNKVQLLTDKEKKKVFSQPEKDPKKKTAADSESQAGNGSQVAQKKQVNKNYQSVTSRLYQPKKDYAKEKVEEKVQEVKPVKAKVSKPRPQTAQIQSSVNKQQKTEQKQEEKANDGEQKIIRRKPKNQEPEKQPQQEVKQESNNVQPVSNQGNSEII